MNLRPVISPPAASPGVLTFERPTITVLEGVGTAQIIVIRVNGSYSPISVRYRVVGVTTGPYAQVAGQLFFPDGVLKKVIEIPISDNNVRGPDIILNVELYEPSLKTDVMGGICALTIVDDDMIPGYLELESPQLRVPESAGSIQVKVMRREGRDGQIRIRYKTVSVTAQTNLDFSPIMGELIFENGEETKTLTVDIFDDTIREPSETFRIELFDPSTGIGVLNFRNRGSILTTEITIEDNDKKFCQDAMFHPIMESVAKQYDTSLKIEDTKRCDFSPIMECVVERSDIEPIEVSVRSHTVYSVPLFAVTTGRVLFRYLLLCFM
ncbi:g-protein coupled receptor 98 [Nephila pilipes]|uniref:G-protein coupled receptor 98 n=1 Tax=Nephila pilipes TaxID=299642 RepID=A0A8X6T781_NEPPI|nr:g-protein coupled receptor 98 [Nephila pilipes]